MTNINFVAGYRQRPKSFWPKALLFFAVLAIIIIWAFSTPTKQEPPAKSKAIAKNATAKNLPLPADTLKAAKEEPAKTEPPKLPLAKPSGQKVTRATTCKAVSKDNLPTNITTNFTGDAQRIYYHIQIESPSVPQQITHIWYNPQGQKVATIPLYLTNTNANTYSFVTISGQEKGKWTVETRDASGNLLNTLSFIVGTI